MNGHGDEEGDPLDLPLPPDDWAAHLISFWFVDHGRTDWFGGGEAFDATVSDRFGAWRQALRRYPADQFLHDAQTALAAVLLFDQVPRNVYRGNAEAFATDDLALAIARRAVAQRLDAGLPVDQRLFLYLPFEHSEDIADQREALRLISALGDADYTAYAQAHHDVIARFARFPHRNVVLGRADRPGEAEAVANGAIF